MDTYKFGYTQQSETEPVANMENKEWSERQNDRLTVYDVK